MNKVSVIIPTYNREKTIIRAVESVLSQDYSNIEVLVIDDGSTDKTEQIVFEKIKDSRLKYIKIKNSGAANARNYGINICEGEYVAFQDSDDEWLSGKLSKQMKVFTENKDIGLVYTGFKKIQNGKDQIVPTKKDKILHGYLYKELLKRNFIGCPTVVVKKSCFNTIGKFSTEISKYEDWELFIRIAKQYNIGYIEGIFVNSYFSDDGLNNFNQKESIRSLNYIIQKNENKYFSNKWLFLYAYYLRIINLYVRNNNKIKVLYVLKKMTVFLLRKQEKEKFLIEI